jgi:hypothetical protein
LHIGAEQPREHFADVCETAVAEHRCAVRKLADRTSRILGVAAHEIHEQLSDDSAVLGVALCERQNLLEVLVQRCRHCIKPSQYGLAHRFLESKHHVRGKQTGRTGADVCGSRSGGAPFICPGTETLLVMA